MIDANVATHGSLVKLILQGFYNYVLLVECFMKSWPSTSYRSSSPAVGRLDIIWIVVFTFTTPPTSKLFKALGDSYFLFLLMGKGKANKRHPWKLYCFIEICNLNLAQTDYDMLLNLITSKISAKILLFFCILHNS